MGRCKAGLRLASCDAYWGMGRRKTQARWPWSGKDYPGTTLCGIHNHGVAIANWE